MIRSGITYNTQMQKIIAEIRRAINENLMPIVEQEKPAYTADAWPERIQDMIETLKGWYSSKRFNDLADSIAGSFVRSTVSAVDKKNKIKIGINVFGNSEKITNYLKAATVQNAGLIKSIPEQYLNNVSNTVLTAMRNGVLPQDIASSLKDDYGVTQRRARFIARDQAAKVNGEIDKQRQIDSGFVYFKWIDSADERVRTNHEHIALRNNGFGVGVYRWDDLPLSDKGEKIQPGSDYNCRCTAKAVPTSTVKKYMEKNK